MRSILITGGGLENKGAQAMLFICVDELSKRFPNHRILVVSDSDYENYKDRENPFRFDFIKSMDYKYSFYKMGGIKRIIAKVKGVNQDEFLRLNQLLSQVDMLIDISGYALASKWSYSNNMLFLSYFMFSKAYGYPSYIMPQSFGPFEYKGIKGAFIKWCIRHYLRVPKLIFAREKNGYDLLKTTIKSDNIHLSCDLVLRTKHIESKNVFSNLAHLSDKSMEMVENNSVCIIPNIQNFRYISKARMIQEYQQIIDYILNSGKNVYIMNHSKEDIELCHEIKNHFLYDERVHLLANDYNCIQLCNIIKKFDYIIASRYHSIVHSYKSYVPCLVIGWSDKYCELLELLHQNDYMIDLRKENSLNDVVTKLSILNTKYKNEVTVLSSIVQKLQSENIFDMFDIC